MARAETCLCALVVSICERTHFLSQAAYWLQQKSADTSHLAIALVYKQSRVCWRQAGKNEKHDKHLRSILDRLWQKILLPALIERGIGSIQLCLVRLGFRFLQSLCMCTASALVCASYISRVRFGLISSAPSSPEAQWEFFPFYKKLKFITGILLC